MRGPTNVFSKEIREDTKDRRGLLLKFLVPVIILIPLALTSIPDDALSGIIVIVMLFNGTLGASIGLINMKEKGFLDRLLSTPVNRRTLFVHYILANSLMDLAQVLFPVIVILLLRPVGPFWFPLIIAFLFFAALTANSIGTIIGVLMKRSGEVHMIAMLSVLGIVLLSGLFLPSSMDTVLFALSPFKGLDTTLRSAWDGSWDPSIFYSLPLLVLIFALTLSLHLTPEREWGERN